MSADPLVSVRFGADGLVPVVICDESGAVLTLAYANREAVELTLATGETHLFSRSRNELWRKGATSGNTQHVLEVRMDCDGDALLYRVVPNGPACHTGAQSCFFTQLREEEAMPIDDMPTPPNEATFEAAIAHLRETIAQRRSASPDESYVAKLFDRGVDLIGKKVGEEAVEVVIAAKNANREEIVWETADLFFHTLVLLEHAGVTLDEIGAELLRRAR